jgi:hypothetical protein
VKIFGLAFWEEMSRGAVRISKRYPFSVVSGLLCAVALSCLIDDSLRSNEIWQGRLVKLGICGGFGISLFLLAELVSSLPGERLSFRTILAHILCVAFLMALYVWIPNEDGEELLNTFWIRILMLGGLVHLAIAVVPYWKSGVQDIALWEWNKVLFTRFLLSAFYSAVFFLGVVLALVSIDKLFGVKIDEEYFGRVWVFCAFVLSPFLFLGGLPEAEERVGLTLDYPKWIHFFCKFILLPLVVIYFVILFAYALKILIGWSWPNGMVGLPVFILASVGGLTGLLIWPLSKVEPITPWAKSFWRFFFPLFIPLAILLLLAMQRRIADYGFTELRFLGLLLGLWILGVSIFFAIRPGASFKVIPWSLIALGLVFSVGPLSPASVAFKSQWGRLNDLLQQEGLLANGSLSSNPHEVSTEVFQGLESMVRYLRNGYGAEVFSPLLEGVRLLPRNVKSETEWVDMSRYDFAYSFVDYTGLVSINRAGNRYFDIQVNDDQGVAVADNSLLFGFSGFRGRSGLGDFYYEGKQIQIFYDQEGVSLKFSYPDGKEIGSLELTSWVADHRNELEASSENKVINFDPAELSFGVELEGLGPVQVIVRRLYFYRNNEKWLINNSEFWILVPNR